MVRAMNNRRLMTRQEAADYLSISVSTFHGWVTDARMPACLPGTRRWDKLAIDKTLDRLSGIDANDAEDESDLEELEKFYGQS